MDRDDFLWDLNSPIQVDLLDLLDGTPTNRALLLPTLHVVEAVLTDAAMATRDDDVVDVLLHTADAAFTT